MCRYHGLHGPDYLLRDPLATSVNRDRFGRGTMRFGGYETKMTKRDMEDNPHIFDDIKFEDIKFGWHAINFERYD